MDSETNIQELKNQVMKFCEERDLNQYHNAKELTISIVTEASELLQYFRFKSEKEVDSMFKNELKRQMITEEVADVLIFLIRLAQRYGIDLSEELNKKLIKNGKKYPIEKSRGLNTK